jgi:hypothetical protein
VPQISVFGAAIFSVFKPLTLKTKPLTPDLTDQPAREKQNQSGGSVGREGAGDLNLVFEFDSDPDTSQNSSETWDLDALLKGLGVNPASRKRMRDQGIRAEQFVAWLLQGLTMRNVDPLRLAISWTLNPNLRDEAGEDFKRLARSPGALRRLARERASGFSKYSADWGASPDIGLSQAYRRAFGDSAPMANRVLEMLFNEQVDFGAFEIPTPQPQEIAS